jgi:hypothetical protein
MEKRRGSERLWINADINRDMFDFCTEIKLPREGRMMEKTTGTPDAEKRTRSEAQPSADDNVHIGTEGRD